MQGRKSSAVSCALPETAASVAVAATLVGAAASLLVKRTKAPEATEVSNQHHYPWRKKVIILLAVVKQLVIRQNKSQIWFNCLPKLNFLNIKMQFRECEDCGGSGICSECKGEGFVLKKLSDENAEKARLLAKNAATRYTAGYYSLLYPPLIFKLFSLTTELRFIRLPKKWSYCTKCSSARSCSTCGGRGKLNS